MSTIMNLDHMDLRDCSDHANKGKFFENRDNIGKNLQVELKEDPFTLAKVRGVRFKKSDTKATVSAKLYQEIGGRRGPPILFSDNPVRTCAELNSPLMEVIPFEPLHDIKGLNESSFKYVPGKSKCKDKFTAVQSTVSDIICHSYDHKKDKNSAEDVMKQLIRVVQTLQDRFFPHAKEDGFTMCKSCETIIFRISKKPLCEKCLYFTYYRSLLEISIYSYKDDSKRNAATALRLHNLIFIFYKCVKEIQKIDKIFNKTNVQNIAKVQNSVYFFDIIFYSAVLFELHNPLSYHAGKQEDKFRQIKKIIDNNTNRQQFSPLFLKTVFKRIAIRQYFNKTVESVVHSTVSKAITNFYQVSPELEISFDGNLFDVSGQKGTSTSRDDFLSHLSRISNFIVSNKNLRFIKVAQSSSDWAIHFPIYKECLTKCLNLNDKCISCQSKIFPAFGINNLSISSIKNVIEVKKQLYSLHIVNQLFTPNRVMQDSDINLQPPSKRLKSSESATQLEFNLPLFLKLLKQNSPPPLREQLPTGNNKPSVGLSGISLSSLLNRLSILPTPADYDKLKYSDLVRVCAKLIGLVDAKLIKMDSASNRLQVLSAYIDANYMNCEAITALQTRFKLEGS